MRALWLTLAVGCSAAPAPKPVAPAERVAPTPDASPPIDASPPPSVDEGPPLAADTPIAPECRSAKLDLRAIANNPACHTRDAPDQSLPPTVALTIDPKPVRVAGGAQAKAALVLTNSTGSEVDLLLDDACGGLTKLDVEMVDAKDNRVDVTGDQCGFGQGCGGDTVRVALAPHGVARLDFEVDARKLAYDKDCKASRVGRVAAGSYTLVVANSAFGEVRSSVKVR